MKKRNKKASEPMVFIPSEENIPHPVSEFSVKDGAATDLCPSLNAWENDEPNEYDGEPEEELFENEPSDDEAEEYPPEPLMTTDLLEFRRQIRMTNNEDLITIIVDQKDLYSKEELEIIKEELENRI